MKFITREAVVLYLVSLGFRQIDDGVWWGRDPIHHATCRAYVNQTKSGFSLILGA